MSNSNNLYISEQDILEIIKETSGVEIDKSDPKVMHLVSCLTGGVLLLFPEAKAIMIESGLGDSDETALHAMRVIGKALLSFNIQ